MKGKLERGWYWHLLLVAALLVQLWPLLFMFSTSFKTMNQIFQSSLNPIPTQPVWDNYLYVLQNLPLAQYTANTFVIAGSITVAKLMTSVLAGFAFVYYEFPHKEKFFNALLLTFFIPITVIMLPNYLLMAKLGAVNTAWGVILPQLADGMGVFLMRQTMRNIPVPLLEAARIENAGPIVVLWRIVLPLIKPSFIAMGIVFFINAWNDYFWPMLVLGDQSGYTLPLALQMFISAEGGSEWGVAMAVAALTSLPPLILYLVCQRFIINTFLQSGVKG
jgi:sn-glycerol 3-phosphate transport system permease protein